MSIMRNSFGAAKSLTRYLWEIYLKETTTSHNLAQRVTHSNIDIMTGTQFEHFIAQLLQQSGYFVKVVGGANDRGADVVGRTRTGQRIVVQCKRYAASKKVSSKEMQLFVGMALLEHEADFALYVTSSLYTQQASDIARKHNIFCIDRLTLERWVNGNTPSFILNR